MKKFFNGFWIGMFVSTLLISNMLVNNGKWLSGESFSYTFKLIGGTIKYYANLVKSSTASYESIDGIRTTDVYTPYKKKKSTNQKTSKTNVTKIENNIKDLNDDLRKKIAEESMRYIGTPYRYGGTTPRGFDCSGFVQYVYKQVGIKIPRTVRSIAFKLQRTTNPKVGDLIIINGYRHIGIYLGEGNFIHSSSSKGITINNVSESYYRSRITGYVTFK